MLQSAGRFVFPAFGPMIQSAGVNAAGVESTFGIGFDGVDDRIEIADADAFSFTTGSTDRAGSVAIWVLPNSIATNQIIISKRDQSISNGAEWWIGFGATYLNFTLGDGTTEANRIGRLGPALQVGAWSLVVATYDGSGSASGIKIYVNGRQVDNANDVAGVYVRTRNSDAKVQIGAYKDGTFRGFLNGRVDDARYYSVALTAAQISDMYENTTAPPTTGLVDCFAFEEGNGATTTGSVAGLVGTLTNGPTWEPQVPERLISGRNSETWSNGFNGTSYINLASAIPTTTTFTLSAWVKSSTGGAYADIFTTALNENGLYYNGALSKLSYFFAATDHLSDALLKNNAWNHVAFSVSAGTGTFYINGYPAGTVSSVPTLSLRTIGYNNTANIKDIRVYFSALPVASIRTLARWKEPADTMAHRWRLNEGTGTVAVDSVGGTNGTLTNGPTWTGDVPRGFRSTIESSQCLGTMNGSSHYVQIPDADSLSFITGSAGFTLSAWVNRTGTGADSIIDKYESTGFEYVFGYFSDGLLYVWVYGGGNLRGRTAPAGTSNVWHHVAATWTGVSATSAFAIFTDGVRSDSADFTSGGAPIVSNTPTPVSIGRGNPGLGTPAGYFGGLIDEVWIHNRPWSAAEAADAAAGFLVDAGLVSRWKLDGSAVDAVGTNHGTENGGVGYSSSVPGTL